MAETGPQNPRTYEYRPVLETFTGQKFPISTVGKLCPPNSSVDMCAALFREAKITIVYKMIKILLNTKNE